MTESHRDSGSPNRFDWGPPSGKVSESLKEWLVYPILFGLVLGAGWFLVDLDHQQKPAGATHPVDLRSRPVTLLRGPPLRGRGLSTGLTDAGAVGTRHAVPLRNGGTRLPKASRSSHTAQGATRNTAQGADPGVDAGRSLFFVQLGAFAEEDSAQEAFQRAMKAGFPASMAGPDEQYDMYRLLMGPYATEQEAEQNSRKLQDLDFPSFVIESM